MKAFRLRGRAASLLGLILGLLLLFRPGWLL